MNAGRWLALVIAPLIVTMSGCVVQDQYTTLIINSDGSADLMIIRTNIRSSAEGAQAQSQIDDYRASLDDQTHDDFNRLREAGATIEESRWLRKQVPMTHVVRASIPDESSLENLARLRDGDGAVLVDPKFTSSGVHRRFALTIMLKPDQLSPPTPNADVFEEFKRSRATGISDLRICVTDGKIVAARGFTIAGDGQSALLDETKINTLIHTEGEEVEVFIQWELSD